MILSISSENKKKYFYEKKKGGVIYKITNNIDGKFYIGSTNNFIKGIILTFTICVLIKILV